jgi:hypothetical protein
MFASAFLFLPFLALSACPSPLQSGRPETQNSEAVLAKVAKPFSFKQIVAIAVYPYREKYADLDPKKCPMNFAAFKSDEVKEIAGPFLWGKSINGSPDGADMGSAPDAYIYFRDSAGNTSKAARVVGAWQFILVDNDWEKLRPVTEAGSQILKRVFEATRERDGLP